MAENAIFDETQRLHQNRIVRFVTPITLFAVVVGSGTGLIVQGVSPIGVVAMIAAVVVLTAGFAMLPMRTRVSEDALHARSLIGYGVRVPTEHILDARAVQYHPITECGGWGVRRSRKYGLIFNTSGDRGVHIRYTADGKEKSMLIGSRRSEELAHAIGLAADLPEHASEHGDAPSVAG